MKLNIVDYVTRNSYNNDTIFKIIEINNEIVKLKSEVNVQIVLKIAEFLKVNSTFKCN